MNATLNMTLLAYYVIANKRTLNRSRAYNSPINVRKLWYWIAVCLKCSLAELNFYSAANGYGHPVLPCLLMKLFKLIVLCRQVPASFGYSYTVPIPKIRDCVPRP